MSFNIYFAADEAQKTAATILRRAENWQNQLLTNGLRDKWRDMYKAYHGAYYSSMSNSHQITFSGEQDEYCNLPVNHFRNLAKHVHNMTTSNRPALEARATNTDYKSLTQTILANNILDYYVREKKLEKYLKVAVEYAIVFGAGYIKMEWDSTLGDIYDTLLTDDGQEIPLYDGDIIFTNLAPQDVLFDGTRENDDHNWVCCRSSKNKFDLAAKYPEYKDKILELKTKSEEENFSFGMNSFSQETEEVFIYEFYHKKTPAVPNGRYILFLSEDIVLVDTPMPYRMLPVFKITAGNILGTPYGYTPFFDILPIQEAVNSLYSTILTNQSTFGVQNIWIKRGSDINVSSLHGGLNVIESNEQPVPLNLTQTPKEIFSFLELLEKAMETISGVNSVARGDPQASLKSGAALALVQSMALQFASGLQQSYVELMEDIGTSLIKMLQDYANSPRLVAVTGKNNRTEMKEFNKSDISNISRIIVDIGNPLTRTTAGRVQMADNLLQYLGADGKISAQQYVSIINTGKLEVMTDDIQHALLLIKAENEKLLDGKVPTVIATEQHMEHINGHSSVLSDPDLKEDAELVARVLGHIQSHIEALRTTNPDLLMALGQQPLQPLPPPAGTPDPQTGEMMQPPTQGIQGLMEQNAEIVGPGMEQPINIPSIPEVPANVLPNPQLQANAMGNVAQ